MERGGVYMRGRRSPDRGSKFLTCRNQGESFEDSSQK
jgi:hypothetical protein